LIDSISFSGRVPRVVVSSGGPEVLDFIAFVKLPNNINSLLGPSVVRVRVESIVHRIGNDLRVLGQLSVVMELGVYLHSDINSVESGFLDKYDSITGSACIRIDMIIIGSLETESVPILAFTVSVTHNRGSGVILIGGSVDNLHVGHGILGTGGVERVSFGYVELAVDFITTI